MCQPGSFGAWLALSLDARAARNAESTRLHISFPIVLWYQHSWENEIKKSRTCCKRLCCATRCVVPGGASHAGLLALSRLCTSLAVPLFTSYSACTASKLRPSCKAEPAKQLLLTPCC